MSEISPDWPLWYDSAAPFGSALRYIASLSPRVKWAAVFKKTNSRKGARLEAGPSIGKAIGRQAIGNKTANVTRLVFPIGDRSGRCLGELAVELLPADPNPTDAQPDDQVDDMIRKVAKELGELWPA